MSGCYDSELAIKVLIFLHLLFSGRLFKFYKNQHSFLNVRKRVLAFFSFAIPRTATEMDGTLKLVGTRTKKGRTDGDSYYTM